MSQRGAARRFESLAQLGQAISASLELPAVLDAITNAVRGIVAEASAAIWVCAGDRLRLAAETPARTPSARRLRRELAFGEGLVGRIASDRELLVIDVIMPHMSGRDVAERVEAIRPDIRVLYISGYTDDVLEPHALLNPGRPLLQKPFTPEGLAQAIRRVLDSVPALT